MQYSSDVCDIRIVESETVDCTYSTLSKPLKSWISFATADVYAISIVRSISLALYCLPIERGLSDKMCTWLLSDYRLMQFIVIKHEPQCYLYCRHVSFCRCACVQVKVIEHVQKAIN